MEEEKKYKKKVKREEETTVSDDEFSSSKKEEEVSVSDYKISTQPVLKPKKAYKVVLVRATYIVYEVEDGTNSFVPNIWGTKFKPGDEIYL